jgi:Rrf2 family protein
MGATMSRSTRLASAAAILAYVAAEGGGPLTTDAIAEAVADHPARVRQLVAALVKAGLLNSARGAGGGVALARAASAITLADLHAAVEEQPMLSLGLRETVGTDEGVLRARLAALYAEMEAESLRRLGQVTLTALYSEDG